MPIWTKIGGKKLVGTSVAEESIGKSIDNLKTYGAICGMEWAGSATAIASKLPMRLKMRRLNVQ